MHGCGFQWYVGAQADGSQRLQVPATTLSPDRLKGCYKATAFEKGKVDSWLRGVASETSNVAALRSEYQLVSTSKAVTLQSCVIEQKSFWGRGTEWPMPMDHESSPDVSWYIASDHRIHSNFSSHSYSFWSWVAGAISHVVTVLMQLCTCTLLWVLFLYGAWRKSKNHKNFFWSVWWRFQENSWKFPVIWYLWCNVSAFE